MQTAIMRVVVGVTGASGQIYAMNIIKKLRSFHGAETEVIFTATAMSVYREETGEDLPYPLVDNDNYYNRNASGSNAADIMIIIPCTMGAVGRIAAGSTTDLISRVAEVQLKERKKLLIIPRETPLSLIHLRNLTTLTEAGAIIAPASPSFYNHPKDIEELAGDFTDRILDLAGIMPLEQGKRWRTEQGTK
jgi:4-hydroxy-3-polyprenylbenzoate decarboxylase